MVRWQARVHSSTGSSIYRRFYSQAHWPGADSVLVRNMDGGTMGRPPAVGGHD